MSMPVASQKFRYGTSGFRMPSEQMKSIVYRTAFFSGLYSRSVKKTVGLMITASHNPPGDNGVKVISACGGMLPVEYETTLTNFVNSEDTDGMFLEEYGKFHLMDQSDPDDVAEVMVGTDTRESSPTLLLEALKGLQKAKATAVIYYHHTTPQLHFIVRCCNNPTFGNPRSYVSTFTNALKCFSLFIPVIDNQLDKHLYLDCANGVGAYWARKYCRHAITFNTFSTNELNHNCGADYVKISKKLPTGFDNVPIGQRCASLDGDADRVVYFYEDCETKQLNLMDGDYIAALFALFISQQLNGLHDDSELPSFSFGVVQTAYSDGNSTRFFKEKLNIETIITKTGVKYLEEAAHMFDIGIYFEANGHGTVCFSEKFHSVMRSYGLRNLSMDVNSVSSSLLKLLYFSRMVNEVVGDGLTDIMAVEALLQYFNWSIQDWRKNTFETLPSIQLKVEANVSLFETEAENETILIRPPGLQEKIDTIVKEFPNSRAFVRPSGTEPIVRVFVEAPAFSDAAFISNRLKELIIAVQQ